eukprot:5244488-Karenia_brevis.AAC.1
MRARHGSGLVHAGYNFPQVCRAGTYRITTLKAIEYCSQTWNTGVADGSISPIGISSSRQ